MASSTNNGQQMVVTISVWSMVYAVLVVFGVYVLWSIRDILLLLFIALILASALYGWVQWLHQRRIPKAAAVLLIYVGLFLLLSGIVALLIPPLVDQIGSIASHLPEAIDRLSSGFESVKQYSAQAGVNEEIKQWLEQLSRIFTQNAGGPLSAITGFFGSVVSFVVVLVIAMYLIIEDDAIKRALQSIIPERHSERIGTVVTEIQFSVGMWLRGQLILMLIIGILTYIGLLILGVNNALALALFAGLTELVPTLGPIVGSIPAIILAFTQSPIKALLLIILYVVIQQLENNLIVPQVMRRTAGLNPIVSLIALLIGASIGGITGAIMAIPTVTALKVIGNHVFEVGRKNI
ncbi:AI-2E family transporter [Candidatus Uhrbacteria bacterium]|nr:AI-2E family transporter [Candidatus Uhrbacteria bacterium]